MRPPRAAMPPASIDGSMRKRHVTRLRVRVDEMLECHYKLQRVPFVATRARSTDIVGDHLTNSRAAARLVDQILAKRRGGNIGYVLMLCDRTHLVFRQSAQRKAILER